ncbi:MAG: glycosyltransferase, partial [Deltaproteobacteria bacterium]|nr:glycosyltransferase [Deltaproteobacteria bacterium]
YHHYVLRARQRDALRAHLRESGLETGIHSPTPLHLQPAWQACYGQRLSLPQAERAAREIVSLPVFPDLTQAEVDYVIEGVRSFFQRAHPQVVRPRLSLVIPFHNEEGNVGALYREVREVADRVGQDCELVLVNDGSQDRTGAILDEITRTDPWVRVVHLPSNQGEAAALSTGFQQARGRVIVTLDGDGQNDPHDIPTLLAKMNEGYPVVSGWRRRRQEDYWLRILPSRLANGLIAWVTGVPVHDCGCGLKAYRREILAGLALPRGMHRFLPVILRVPAEAVAEVEVNDRARPSGRSHYGLSRGFAVLRDLLPVHCIRRGARTATWGLIGAALVATMALLYLIQAEVSSSSPGKLTALVANGAGVVYLSVAYYRLREFIKAQSQQSDQFSERSAKIGG